MAPAEAEQVNEEGIAQVNGTRLACRQCHGPFRPQLAQVQREMPASPAGSRKRAISMRSHSDPGRSIILANIGDEGTASAMPHRAR